MARTSNREKILHEGLRVVHERGFAGASVRDIVQAAGVPQGSFTNHFGSKEAFGLEVIDLYFAGACGVIRETLLDDSRPPLERLAAYIDGNRHRLNQDEMRNGCLFGNFAAEASAESETIRLRLVDVFAEIQRAIAYCLRAAAARGELKAGIDCDDTAGFIISSLQGANLLAKVHRDPAPVDRFKKTLFSTILR